MDIGQNTEKIPVDLRRVAVTQIPVKDHLQTLTWKNLQEIIIIIITKGTGGLGSWWTSGDYPNYYIIENGQSTEKSPGDLKRFAVTQTPVKDNQLTLMWKTVMSKK